MDENSRKGETSERAENSANNQGTKKTGDRVPELENVGVKIKSLSGRQEIQVSDLVESSLENSGTSSNAVLSCIQEENDKKKISRIVDDDDDDDEGDTPVPHQPTVNFGTPRRVYQQRVRLVPPLEQSASPGKLTVGPPPSYSFVMNQKARIFKPRRSITPAGDRPPPPPYTGMQRSYLPPEQAPGDTFYNLPSFSEPMWRSHSQPALCPRCGIIILTTTHSHDSVATHVAALALCLFGCWPCCLLPYCMNACKNTYHHCPVCQTFLGSYAPW